MYLLYKATSLQTGHIPMGTVYAIWAGIGAVGTALMGTIIFKEPTDFWRIFFIFTLIASIVGLKFVSH
jgi:quaternary ammonium compound-resistance protein SugE